MVHKSNKSADAPSGLVATLGGGCFWCLEAVYECTEGVGFVQSGFMGGHTASPTYEEVCAGNSGHAEVIQICFDPVLIPYEKLLKIFWMSHDPTTLNQQGPDIGTQYRSVIFYHSDEQRIQARRSKDDMNVSGRFDNNIVTEITRASEFHEASGDHQSYFKNNPTAPYCQFVIAPKMAKLNQELVGEGLSWKEPRVGI
ncbi:MAG: Peptide methionine sulfoxide reductase MsrA [Candidatus Moanabacter tarae]|uniref:Peptide methionine sulfoxide reductase MsrA n=1 Tax=Candidatus Moanibacter tarae TaxID=2200854 RepID=A0A2Z4AHS0_9BACT|nr:MAG: Peptide methionine sulfoxide reductase MsrA [Candidatus Moanabacter tarae]|tara:strand:- start:45563 stop:46156 length:594 start_codon:yes stop_codon:yes gene_type:complete